MIDCQWFPIPSNDWTVIDYPVLVPSIWMTIYSVYHFYYAWSWQQIVSIMLAIKIVDTIKNDSTSEISPIISNDAFFVTFTLFVLSSFNWCAFSYAASFMFKSDVASFITVLIISSVAGFIDMICAFVYLFVKLDNQVTRNTVVMPWDYNDLKYTILKRKERELLCVLSGA